MILCPGCADVAHLHIHKGNLVRDKSICPQKGKQLRICCVEALFLK